VILKRICLFIGPNDVVRFYNIELCKFPRFCCASFQQVCWYVNYATDTNMIVIVMIVILSNYGRYIHFFVIMSILNIGQLDKHANKYSRIITRVFKLIKRFLKKKFCRQNRQCQYKNNTDGTTKRGPKGP